MGTPKLVAYRERIFKHASQMNRFFPHDYNLLLKWIPEYDLSLQPEKIAGRPLLFWHGREDVVVPYQHVVEFIAEHGDKENIQFIEEDEAHLVRPETMEKITQFFVEAML